jgi:hypothetical protein
MNRLLDRPEQVFHALDEQRQAHRSKFEALITKQIYLPDPGPGNLLSVESAPPEPTTESTKGISPNQGQTR